MFNVGRASDADDVDNASVTAIAFLRFCWLLGLCSVFCNIKGDSGVPRNQNIYFTRRVAGKLLANA